METRKTADPHTAEALDAASTVPTTGGRGDRAVASEDPQQSLEAREIEVLSRKLSLAYKHAVEYYREKEGMSFEAADKQARRSLGSMSLYEIHLEGVTWTHLSRAVHEEEDGAYEFWRYLKRFAKDEFESGHRAALSMSHKDTPLQRARFLAVRDALIAEWKPRGASELMLIDSMVQAFSAKLFWLEELHRRSIFECREDQNKWNTPRVTEAEAIELAAKMVERFDKIYLRNLRGLRDLRRYASGMVIQSTGQINIAQQQIIRQDGTNRESATAQDDSQSESSGARTDAVGYLGPEHDESQVLNATSHF